MKMDSTKKDGSSMKNRTISKTRIVAELFFLMVLIGCLSACGAKETAVETYLSDEGVSLPRVTGVAKSDEINAALEKLFTPYAERIQQTVDASDGKLQIVYEIGENKGLGLFDRTYDLTMQLTDGKDKVKITGAVIHKADDIQSDGSEPPEWVDSAEITRCVLLLRRAGIEPELGDLTEPASEKYTLDAVIALYESIAGWEYDASDVQVGASVGEDFQKAIKMKLIDAYGNYDGYQYAGNVYIYDVVNMASVVIDRIEADVYGHQCDSTTRDDFAALLRTMYRICRVKDQPDSPYRWEALGEVDFAAAAAQVDDVPEDKFTRENAAELLCRITQLGPKFSRIYSDDSLVQVEDCDDSIWVQRAVTYDFMSYYGDWGIFAPEAYMSVTNAVKTAGGYFLTRYGDWSFANNYEWDGLYTKEDVLLTLGEIAAYFDDRPIDQKYRNKPVTVINDRDYDWFFSQKNTGASSGVNCMPSIAAMAAHWYDKDSTVTVQDMRATGKSTDAWTAINLRGALDAYQIPYTVESVTMENILSAIDEGKIVLVQYSDRPDYMTGHCYVIYGYRKQGDAITFIVQDSESLVNYSEIFGRPKGNGDEVEGAFGLWSIDRFVSSITVVG